MRMTRAVCVILVAVSTAIAVAVAPTSAAVAEHRSSATQRHALDITVYGDFAVVRDARLVSLERGENLIEFDDVSPQMASETAFLQDLSAQAPVWVHEQNFETNLLSPDAIFSKAVGHTVMIIRYEPKKALETRDKAVILSQNGPILQFRDRVETSLPPNSRIAYYSIPSLPRTPALTLDFESSATSQHVLALQYLTNGFSWTADYVARLRNDSTLLDIDAFATVRNTSGVDFDDAFVHVVAGNVQRAQVQPQVTSNAYTLGKVAVPAAPAEVYAGNANRALRQPVSEFYQYALPYKTSLKTGETKQTLLLFARDVPAEIRYEAYISDDVLSSGADNEPEVDSVLQFQNAGRGLGVPLPRGVFHLYTAGQSGQMTFIGEDSIDNTAKNEPVRLDLGQSLDIKVHSVQTDYLSIPHPPNKPTEYLTSYRVTVRNAKNKPITLRYQDTFNGEWQITKESLPHQKLSSTSVLWLISVPAGGETVLTFSVDAR